MVSNLLVVLCGDRGTQPIVNAGSSTTRTVPDNSAPERKSILLRLDPAVHDALARWAADELRSTNAQIEFLLRQSPGRLPAVAVPPAPAQARPPEKTTGLVIDGPGT